MLVDPRHFHLLKTPKDATKDHPCHLSPPWYGSMPGQTLRSYRSHRVYTAYIVRSGGNSPPPKKNGWIQNPYWEKEEYYPHICDPTNHVSFTTPVILRLIMTSSEKRGEFQASLDSKSSLFGAPLKAAHKVNCCDLFRPAYVHWDCQILPCTQKKVLGEHKKKWFKSPIFITFLGISRSRFLYWMPPGS